MASTVWRGYITFGLISIPVRLFRAARAERVGLRRLAREEPPARTRGTVQPIVAPAPSGPEMTPKRGAVASARAETVAPESMRAVPISQAEPVLTPVRHVAVKNGTEDVLAERSIVKGYEFEKGRYVVLEAEELKSLAPKTSSGME